VEALDSSTTKMLVTNQLWEWEVSLQGVFSQEVIETKITRQKMPELTKWLAKGDYIWSRPLVPASGQREPAPTSAPYRVDCKWTGSSFLLSSSSVAHHGG